MTFNTEKFIKEIERRQAIWDPSIDEYADRACRRRLWDEITCSVFNNEISEDERPDISKLLQQKWKNIRTSFNRELRRRAGKSGLAISRKSPYIYFDHLKFLFNAVESNKAHKNIDTGQEEYEAEENIDSRQLSSSLPQKMSKVDKSWHDLDQALNRYTARSERSVRKRHQDPETDTDRLFILSLVDDFRNIPTKRKLTAKLEIMKIIKWAQTPLNTHWAPPLRSSHSDHDYVGHSDETLHHSIQKRRAEGIYPYKYTSSPSLQQQLIEGRLLACSDSDISNESDIEEVEVIEEETNGYES